MVSPNKIVLFKSPLDENESYHLIKENLFSSLSSIKWSLVKINLILGESAQLQLRYITEHVITGILNNFNEISSSLMPLFENSFDIKVLKSICACLKVMQGSSNMVNFLQFFNKLKIYVHRENYDFILVPFGKIKNSCEILEFYKYIVKTENSLQKFKSFIQGLLVTLQNRLKILIEQEEQIKILLDKKIDTEIIQKHQEIEMQRIRREQEERERNHQEQMRREIERQEYLRWQSSQHNYVVHRSSKPRCEIF